MVRVAVQRLDGKQWAAIQSESQLLSRGSGYRDITIFKKKRRGGGVGSFLGNLIKTYGPKMLPFLRNYILPTAKSMGKDVMNDVASGKSTLKKSLKKRGLQSAGKIAARVVSRGTGDRRRRTVRRSVPNKNNSGRKISSCPRGRRRRTVT